eukprot:3620826-Prymnesium_polylepis.3
MHPRTTTVLTQASERKQRMRRERERERAYRRERDQIGEMRYRVSHQDCETVRCALTASSGRAAVKAAAPGEFGRRRAQCRRRRPGGGCR